MTRAQHKQMILRDLAAILSKDEFDYESRDKRSWQAARDELVSEFERRAKPRRLSLAVRQELP